jgi:DnaJ-class molecular chaperone
MDSESKKIEIRRRLYQSKRNAGEDIDDSLTAFFENCPICRGRGQICTEFEDDGNPGYLLEICLSCDGEGFISKALK